jgi:hypothetical protein
MRGVPCREFRASFRGFFETTIASEHSAHEILGRL